MKHILNTYQLASGQEVNYVKSAITFSEGTPQAIQDQITKMLGITKLGGFGIYLGLPEHIGRKRKEVFKYITYRIKNKIDSWYSKFLSPAGKEVLLKAVITALPTYTMSCFMLPKMLIQDITKAMRKFWWSTNKDRKSMVWIKWDKITLSKKEGGLGFRDMLAFNKALLAKQVWRLITNPSSLLARVFKAKYFRNSDFIDAKSYQTSSYAWRSIIQTQPLIRRGLKWVIGNGEQVRVWKDRWISGCSDLSLNGQSATLYPNLLVKDLFVSGTREWDGLNVRSLVGEEEANKILTIRPSVVGSQDKIRWMYNRRGVYTVKSGYYCKER